MRSTLASRMACCYGVARGDTRMAETLDRGTLEGPYSTHGGTASLSGDEQMPLLQTLIPRLERCGDSHE